MYRGEYFNSITHLIGTVMALGGTAFLIAAALQGPADPRRMVALSIYCAMMIVLYVSSTLYHSLRGPAKQVFHVFDHCAIYLLIAGTYTPFTLVTLRGPWGWTLFAIVWTLAAAGVAKDILFPGRYKVISVVLYVVMGWLVIVAFKPLKEALPGDGIFWIAAGGLVYTAGVTFYALSKRVIHMHGLWHLCVLGGSACHYVAVYRYVAV